MKANGQNNRRVSPLDTWSERPAWAPDGRWIAYQSELENPWGNPNRDLNIYLMTLNAGGKPRQITQHQAMDYSPAWVPSGFLAVSPAANTRTTVWGKLKRHRRTTK
jgi:Tol biopolymer transport system component